MSVLSLQRSRLSHPPTARHSPLLFEMPLTVKHSEQDHERNEPPRRREPNRPRGIVTRDAGTEDDARHQRRERASGHAPDETQSREQFLHHAPRTRPISPVPRLAPLAAEIAVDGHHVLDDGVQRGASGFAFGDGGDGEGITDADDEVSEDHLEG